MSLPEISEAQILEKRLTVQEFDEGGNLTSSPERDLVMLVSEGCAGCGEWEVLVEGLVSIYPTIRFSKLVISPETLPIFAPPVVPSIIGLGCGYREWEAIGALHSTGALEVMIDNWIQDLIDINSISGGESIVPS